MTSTFSSFQKKRFVHILICNIKRTTAYTGGLWNLKTLRKNAACSAEDSQQIQTLCQRSVLNIFWCGKCCDSVIVILGYICKRTCKPSSDTLALLCYTETFCWTATYIYRPPLFPVHNRSSDPTVLCAYTLVRLLNVWFHRGLPVWPALLCV